MKKYIWKLLIIMMFIAGCRSEKKSDYVAEHHEESGHHPDEILFTRQQAEAVGLETETVRLGTFCQALKTSGQIRTPEGHETAVAATVSGIVSYANASIAEGMAIKAGETIAILSAGNIADGDPQAKAKAEYETALSAWQRAEPLANDRIISAKEFDEIRLRYETARTAYEAQASRLTDNGVRVMSPVSGYVKSKIAGQGEYVSAGQTIAVITQNKRLQLRAEAPEAHFEALKKVTDAHFRLSYNHKVYELSKMNGRLLSVGQGTGEASYYIPVTFEFDNVGDVLPGAFAEVFLLTTTEEGVISVPLQALTEEQGLYFVYVRVDEDGYRKQEVQIGMSDGMRVRVISGLQSGDEVVTKGVYQVKLASGSGVIPEGHTHNH
ncbi:MAG: efflux RND transporter periplasmic adaptor subunit [Tannerella sp.]|jgi:RND family efflux transporter MFP subunit|nr:efflux RND transporter periplasmic adaptor subunit [Tannerella sp.]